MDVKTHAFVIRIWNEEAGDDREGVTWRGYVDHVSSGVRYHLRSLEDILPFITQQLQSSIPDSGSHDIETGGAVIE
jgi:hypothetical protein